MQLGPGEQLGAVCRSNGSSEWAAAARGDALSEDGAGSSPSHQGARCLEPAVLQWGACTCFEDEEVQGIITQVGGCGDLMCGDAQDQLLVVTPGEQQAAGRQAQDAVLLRGRLQRQLLQLLQAENILGCGDLMLLWGSTAG